MGLMALELYMVGLTVRDMEKSLEFYRRLGLAVPEDGEERSHVEIKMEGKLTFFLNSKPIKRTAPARDGSTDTYPFLLEFYLESRAALEAKYAELTGLGYESYRAPFETTIGMYLALIKDPDGNTILLSADMVEKAE